MAVQVIGTPGTGLPNPSVTWTTSRSASRLADVTGLIQPGYRLHGVGVLGERHGAERRQDRVSPVRHRDPHLAGLSAHGGAEYQLGVGDPIAVGGLLGWNHGSVRSGLAELEDHGGPGHGTAPRVVYPDHQRFGERQPDLAGLLIAIEDRDRGRLPVGRQGNITTAAGAEGQGKTQSSYGVGRKQDGGGSHRFDSLRRPRGAMQLGL